MSIAIKNKVENGYCFKVHERSFRDGVCICYKLSEWKEIKALVANFCNINNINNTFYDDINMGGYL